jgi:inhibitor of KinA sporulation pathway (predicted exonuclease)
MTDRLARVSCVVFDLEYTAWEGSLGRGWSGPGEQREIVQIGAVRLAPGNGLVEVDALDLLVRPRLNPRLSAYFTALTGIGQARLDREAIAPVPALRRFAAFCAGSPAYSFGNDDRVVRINLELNGLPDFFAPGQLVDFADWLCTRLGVPRNEVSSCDLPARLGLPHAGAAHDALADARAIAAALRHLHTTIGL